VLGLGHRARDVNPLLGSTWYGGTEGGMTVSTAGRGGRRERGAG
jgi:hypothetical protein